MLKLDLGLPTEQLEVLVRERCSRFGTVSTLEIIRDGTRHNFALCVIEMSTPEENLKVLQAFGDSAVASSVVARIEQS